MSKVQFEYADVERPLKRVRVRNDISGRTLVLEPVTDTPDGFIEFSVEVPDNGYAGGDYGKLSMKVSPDAVDSIVKGLTALRAQYSKRRAYR